MKTRGFRPMILLTGLLALSLAVAAHGQMGMGMRPPDIQGIFQPIVGSGAAYDITNGKQQKHSMEITIVGKEAVNGKDSYWLEMGMETDRGTMYMKMLMSIEQNSVITERFIMQSPGQPQPMEMDLNTMMGGNKTHSADFRDKAEQVGAESVTVPAGTFDCTHYRMKDGSGDVWVSPKVVPWGMVKYTGKDSTMVLTKQISDAKDHITGTPIKFDPSQMMRQQQQHPN